MDGMKECQFVMLLLFKYSLSLFDISYSTTIKKYDQIMIKERVVDV